MVSLKDEEIFAEEIHKYFCLFEKKKKKILPWKRCREKCLRKIGRAFDVLEHGKHNLL